MDFGDFKIPEFNPPTKRWLKIIGPIALGICLFLYLPVIPINNPVASVHTDGVIPVTSPSNTPTPKTNINNNVLSTNSEVSHINGNGREANRRTNYRENRTVTNSTTTRTDSPPVQTDSISEAGRTSKFNQLLREAREMREAGIPSKACQKFEEALGYLPHNVKVDRGLLNRAKSNCQHNNWDESAAQFDEAFRSLP